MEENKVNITEARVAVVDGNYEGIERALDKVINDLDLGGWYAGLKGKKVFVKPNMLGLFEPEAHATTNPAVVAGVVKLLRAAGALVTVGDNCGVGGYGLNQRVAKRTGIGAASDGAYVNVAQDTMMARLDSRHLSELPVSRAMMECDVLVSLPKMKTHGLTVVTGAVKNMFGLVAGAGKGKTHASAPGLKDFGSTLAAIYALRPPDLTIMDAVITMEGNGPSSGTPKPLGKIMASTNAVACDAVMCRIMGLPPEEVHHLRYAARRGLGPLDADAITVTGAAPAGARFKLPLTAQRFSGVGRFINQRVFEPLSRTKLSLSRDKCKQCKICVDGCPTGAMGMADKYPEIDEKICIRCFCCHELCPESAWEVKSWLGRMMIGRRG